MDELGNYEDAFAFLKPSFHISDDSPGIICEVKTYEARYNYKGEQIALQVGKNRDLEPQQHQDHNSALVVTRFYNREKELSRTELVIRSPYMKQALKTVVKEYPGVNLESENIVLDGLPKCLFHYREELQNYGLLLDMNSPDFQHILLLLQHMWQRLGTQCTSYYNLMESPRILPGLEFLNLWMAFKPGDFIYMRVKNTHRVVQLKSMTRCECTEPRCEDSKWELEYQYIANDGEQVGYVEGTGWIEPYDGYRALQKLKLFPLRYHPDFLVITAQLIERGKKMMKLRGVHYLMYEGETETLGSNRRITIFGERDQFPLQSRSIKSRVMVDAKTFGKLKPSNKLYLDMTTDKLPTAEGTTHDYILTDDHYIICDYEVPGFSLVDKRWCWFEIERLSEIDFNSEAFEKLLLPADQKQMIRSLVEVHTDKNLSFDDVIKGKGRGMVFLLHGVPGVGKTLTAESVADITKRPLYMISSGELGIYAKTVEENLMAALNLATTWNAIVLIDEADIFLEQRSTNDLERNSLVSIFLRLLEYYEGILFLTTNRIASFDTAFKSRIHLAIKYHALSPDYRASLWNSFIMNTAGEATFPWLTHDYLVGIGSEDLNGRQIKNTVRTAYALAVKEGGGLQPKHIDMALQAMKMFESDFAEVRNEDETNDEPVSKRRRVR